jgi:excisionase family DNA binding protein
MSDIVLSIAPGFVRDRALKAMTTLSWPKLGDSGGVKAPYVTYVPKPKRVIPRDPDALLTAAQAAARLSITVEQLIAHVEDGGLRYINVGRGKKKPRRRFSESDLEEFKAARSTLEKTSCPSSSRKSPRPTTGTASKSNVVGFSALRAARMKRTPSGSRR